MAPSLSSSTPNPKLTSQPPTDPLATTAINRRPKSREVTSRYLTPRTAPNSPSPSNPRSLSAHRYRPPSPDQHTVLSASFRGPTTPLLPVRKSRDGDENVRPSGTCFTTSAARRTFACDYALEKKKLTTTADGRRVARALRMHRSTDYDGNEGPGSTAASDFATSDAESVSSRRPRTMAVPARFWQETTNRIRRLPEQILTKSFGDSNPVSSPPRLPSVRSSSPSKVLSAMSPSRGKLSPSRVRSVIRTSDYVNNTPSVSSFAAGTRRGKVGENKISDMHELKMLHNCQVQWQFANARANAAMETQKDTAEKSINCAREKISELRDSVGSKRVELQHLRQQLKLYSVLEKQMPYLDEWELFDGDYSSSLAGVVESLVSSTLRLPLVGGATANLRDVEETVSSTVDMMHDIGSSLCGLLDKVVQTNSFASELASISRNELSSLDQCRDLLSNLTTMQVEDCCLRTQRLQLMHINP